MSVNILRKQIKTLRFQLLKNKDKPRQIWLYIEDPFRSYSSYRFSIYIYTSGFQMLWCECFRWRWTMKKLHTHVYNILFSFTSANLDFLPPGTLKKVIQLLLNLNPMSQDICNRFLQFVLILCCFTAVAGWRGVFSTSIVLLIPVLFVV